eukprot:evm.model.scf_97.2 EVM.evm.TU.scf_97.2   scf_97:33570-39435(-)
MDEPLSLGGAWDHPHTHEEIFDVPHLDEEERADLEKEGFGPLLRKIEELPQLICVPEEENNQGDGPQGVGNENWDEAAPIAEAEPMEISSQQRKDGRRKKDRGRNKRLLVDKKSEVPGNQYRQWTSETSSLMRVKRSRRLTDDVSELIRRFAAMECEAELCPELLDLLSLGDADTENSSREDVSNRRRDAQSPPALHTEGLHDAGAAIEDTLMAYDIDMGGPPVVAGDELPMEPRAEHEIHDGLRAALATPAISSFQNNPTPSISEFGELTNPVEGPHPGRLLTHGSSMNTSSVQRTGSSAAGWSVGDARRNMSMPALMEEEPVSGMWASDPTTESVVRFMGTRLNEMLSQVPPVNPTCQTVADPDIGRNSVFDLREQIPYFSQMPTHPVFF